MIAMFGLLFKIKHFQETNYFLTSLSRKYSHEGLWESNFPTWNWKF